MRRRSWAVRLILLWIVSCLSSFHAMGGGAEAEQRSGSGWVSFMRFPESPDQTFIQEFLENWEDYRQSQLPHMGARPIEDLWVGYWDLNDDGVEEMFVSFYDASPFFCGTGGCTILLFEKSNGNWRFVDDTSGFHVWVSDEKGEVRFRESIDSWDYRDKRDGYRVFWTHNLCEPVEPELRSKIPESFITNLSC